MDRIPDTIDMAVVADRIKPLAHQASEGLRQTSEGLRHTSEGLLHSLEQAREVIADRIDDVDVPAFDFEPSAALALAAQSLPFIRDRARVRTGRSPLQWLLISIALAVAATVATVVLKALVQRLMEEREAWSPQVGQGGPRAVAPVAIPITDDTMAGVQGFEAAGEDAERDSIEGDEARLEERAVEAG
jgi:hypothetical protein